MVFESLLVAQNIVDPVLLLLDLNIKCTMMYQDCVVCYPMIATPCVRSVDCVFALLYALVDSSEQPWNLS